jgi:hypothetical protein
MSNRAQTIMALLIIVVTAHCDTFGQGAIIRNQIRKNIEEKQGAAQKEKGVKAIEDITYDNDKRYKDFKGNTQATFEFFEVEFDKKGQEKRKRTDKIIFGKLGECMAMNVGEKSESWTIANYIDKAHYMVQVKDKTAMKMPLMNFRKMADRVAQKQELAQIDKEGTKGKWRATTEMQKINGYNCVKYIYTYPEGAAYKSFHVWVTKDVKIIVDAYYFMGTQIGQLLPKQKVDPSMPDGFIVLSRLYKANNLLVTERELVRAENKTEERYFDLSGFKITGVTDALR